jgi:hypothetical protein
MGTIFENYKLKDDNPVIVGDPPVRSDDEHPYTHAMDGDLETWFGKPKNEEGWVGPDLGKGLFYI